MERGHLTWGPFCLFALAGMGISAYLTYVHWADVPILCTGAGGGCDVVNHSEYAELGGIPVALMGGLLYAVLLPLGLASLGRRRSFTSWLPLGAFGLTLAGVAYSAYLTYVELFVLEAICIWCVASAALLFTMLLVATAAVVYQG